MQYIAFLIKSSKNIHLFILQFILVSLIVLSHTHPLLNGRTATPITPVFVIKESKYLCIETRNESLQSYQDI